jgi:hypothetical protein
MPFTIVGWQENVPLATTQQAITALPDEHVRTEGDNIVVPDLNKIVGYYGIGVDIQNVQLSSPELRRIAELDVAPVEITSLPTFPPDVVARPESPINLALDEQLQARCGNSNAGAQDEAVFVMLASGPIVPIHGDIHTILATATAPATANLWANAQLTLSQELPAGDYDLVGARCEQANSRIFRFVFIGGTWRPGTVCVGAISGRDVGYSRYGAMGVWGTFKHNQPPSVDFFGDGVGGAARIYLDIIKRT